MLRGTEKYSCSTTDKGIRTPLLMQAANTTLKRCKEAEELLKLHSIRLTVYLTCTVVYQDSVMPSSFSLVRVPMILFICSFAMYFSYWSPL